MRNYQLYNTKLTNKLTEREVSNLTFEEFQSLKKNDRDFGLCNTNTLLFYLLNIVKDI